VTKPNWPDLSESVLDRALAEFCKLQVISLPYTDSHHSHPGFYPFAM